MNEQMTKSTMKQRIEGMKFRLNSTLQFYLIYVRVWMIHSLRANNTFQFAQDSPVSTSCHIMINPFLFSKAYPGFLTVSQAVCLT